MKQKQATIKAPETPANNYRKAIESQAAKLAADKAAAKALLEKRLREREELVYQSISPLAEVFESHEKIKMLGWPATYEVVYGHIGRLQGFRVGIRCLLAENVIELWYARDQQFSDTFKYGCQVAKAPADQSYLLIKKAIELAAQILTD